MIAKSLTIVVLGALLGGCVDNGMPPIVYAPTRTTYVQPTRTVYVPPRARYVPVAVNYCTRQRQEFAYRDRWGRAHYRIVTYQARC